MAGGQIKVLPLDRETAVAGPATGPGVRRATVTFVAATLVDAVGTGCFLAGSAIFFTRQVGLTPGQVGFGLSLSAGIGLLATIPVGRLADRLGAKRVLVVLLLLRAIGFLGYATVASFPAFVAVSALLGLAEKPTSPVQQALIAEVVTVEQRQRLLALTRAVRNMGFGGGALLTGLLLIPGFPLGLTAIVAVNAVSFLVSAVVMTGVRAAPGGTVATISRRTWRLRDARYLRLTAVNGVLTLHMSLLSTAVPLWILHSTNLPAQVIPALVLLNTVLAVVLQVPVAGLVRTDTHARRMLGMAGSALAVCCLLLGTLPRLGLVAAMAAVVSAMLALTVAELTQAAGGWDLSFRLAEGSRRGQYLSVFSLGVTMQTIVGPWLLTSVVITIGPPGWVALAGALAITGVLAHTVARRPRRG